jgi:hypothetical protein
MRVYSTGARAVALGFAYPPAWRTGGDGAIGGAIKHPTRTVTWRHVSLWRRPRGGARRSHASETRLVLARAPHRADNGGDKR